MCARQRKSSGKMAKIRRIYVSLHTRSNNGRIEAFAGGGAFSMSYRAHKCKRNLLSFKVAKRLFRGKSPPWMQAWKQTRFVASANVKTNEDAAANDRGVAFSHADCRLELPGKIYRDGRGWKRRKRCFFPWPFIKDSARDEREKKKRGERKKKKKNMDRHFSVGKIFPRLKFRRERDDEEKFPGTKANWRTR